MPPKRLQNGNLLVPRRAEGDGWLGDGMVEIGPDHPDHKRWVEDFARLDEVKGSPGRPAPHAESK